MKNPSCLAEALFKTALKTGLDRKQKLLKKKKKKGPVPTISGKVRRRSKKSSSFLKAVFAASDEYHFWVWAEAVLCHQVSLDIWSFLWIAQHKRTISQYCKISLSVLHLVIISVSADVLGATRAISWLRITLKPLCISRARALPEGAAEFN